MFWMLPWVDSVIAGNKIWIYIFYLSVSVNHSLMSEKKEVCIKNWREKDKAPKYPRQPLWFWFISLFTETNLLMFKIAPISLQEVH